MVEFVEFICFIGFFGGGVVFVNVFVGFGGL